MCVTQVCVVYLQCDCNSCCLHWRDVMWSRLMLSWTLSPTVTTEAPTRKLNNSPNTQLNTQPDWRVCVCVCVCVCACCKRLMCPGGGHKPRGASMRMKHTHTHTHTHTQSRLPADCGEVRRTEGEVREEEEQRGCWEDVGGAIRWNRQVGNCLFAKCSVWMFWPLTSSDVKFFFVFLFFLGKAWS